MKVFAARLLNTFFLLSIYLIISYSLKVEEYTLAILTLIFYFLYLYFGFKINDFIKNEKLDSTGIFSIYLVRAGLWHVFSVSIGLIAIDIIGLVDSSKVFNITLLIVSLTSWFINVAIINTNTRNKIFVAIISSVVFLGCAFYFYKDFII